MLDVKVLDASFATSMFADGQIQAVEDIDRADLPQSDVDLLAQFQVRATLVMPIALQGLGSVGAGEQGSRGSRGSRGAGEQGSRGAGEQGSRQGSRGVGEQGEINLPHPPHPPHPPHLPHPPHPPHLPYSTLSEARTG